MFSLVCFARASLRRGRRLGDVSPGERSQCWSVQNQKEQRQGSVARAFGHMGSTPCSCRLVAGCPGEPCSCSPGQLKDVPTHTQCGQRERGARASWHVWAGEASLLIPQGCIIAALHVESFKFVDKHRFNLDFKNFFSFKTYL